MRRRSWLSSKTTWAEYPYWPEVQRFMEGILRLKPVLVVLFGSVARGDFTQESDADVLVIFERPVDWATVYAYSQGMVQPLVKTVDEVLAQIRQGEPFFIEVVEEGKVLYEADRMHERLLADAARAR